jgi:putative Holliday junction resolvase
MKAGRYIGLDPGGRRIGVAISDPGGIIAQPMETLIVEGVEDALDQVSQIIADRQVVGVVLGLPLNLSGDESTLSKVVKSFAEQLTGICEIPIYYEDERLSSRQAEHILHSHGKKIRGNKEKIDRISAAIILQSFLDRLNSSGLPPKPIGKSVDRRSDLEEDK